VDVDESDQRTVIHAYVINTLLQRGDRR
jgi:hypothetical protein